MAFASPDPDFENKIRTSFARQRAMTTLGARLQSVEPGSVEIVLPFREELVQQHGFVHGGVIATVLDSACGYAALTLMPPGQEVLTVEFKINLLRPAAGQEFVARGEVVSAGRRITVARGQIVRSDDPESKPIAHLVATLMAVD
jgi:uncharacterized protein (TIGR00369 family)